MQQRKSKAVKELKDYIKLLPIGLILLIVPVIVYLKKVKLDSVVASYWKGSTTEVDFFSYYKMGWFISLTCISALLFFYYVTTKKIKLTFPKIFLPLVVYLVLVLLSSSLSKYHSIAFLGFPDRYEGFFTIFCYILICFLCAVLINSKFDIKYLLPFLAVSVLVVSIIGFTQFFGFDFLQTGFGKSLMLPTANKNLADGLIFNFPKEYIYSTLYNPNYVGGFFAMILPVCLVLFISTKNTYHKILYSIFCILSFITLLGSKSTTGYISAAIAGIVILIYLRKDLKRNLLPLITIILCFGVTTAVMNYSSGGMIFKELGLSSYFTQFAKIVGGNNSIKLQNVSFNTNKLNDALPETLDLQPGSEETNTSHNTTFKTLALQNVPTEIYSSSDANVETPTPLNLSNTANTPTQITDIKIAKNNLSLYISNTDALVIKYDLVSTSLLFNDNTNKSIEYISNTMDNKTVLTFKDSRFQNIKISVSGNLLAIEAPNTVFNIVITKDGFKFVTPSGRITDIIRAESFGFKGKELWGSSRGYIWSRSIPMLKDTIFLGHGPDTFSIYFPQNDYMGKLHAFSNIYTGVDKPHNIYLQMAINTGVLSLIAFLVFVGWYCIASIKLYFKGVYSEYFAPGVACMVAVISFLVSSIANDSTISVSPVFWIIIGVGIACNRLYSKQLLKTTVSK